LNFLAVDNVLELGRSVSGGTGVYDTEAFQGGDDVAWHAEGNSVSGTIIVNGHTYEFGTFPVNVEVVFGANGCKEVINIGTVAVLDSEVIHDEGEVSVVDGMLEETGGGGGVVTVGGEELTEFLISKTTCVGKAVYTFGDADHSAVAVPGNVGTVTGDNVIRDLLTSEPHILVVTFQVTAKVEIFDIGGAEVGVFRYNGIEKKFDSLHVCSEGGADAIVVGDVAAIGTADSPMKNTVLQLGFNLGVIVSSETTGRLRGRIDPVHGLCDFEEAQELIGFFFAPEFVVPRGTSGAIGERTIICVQSKCVGHLDRSSLEKPGVDGVHPLWLRGRDDHSLRCSRLQGRDGEIWDRRRIMILRKGHNGGDNDRRVK
jgi:hypothetical protein